MAQPLLVSHKNTASGKIEIDVSGNLTLNYISSIKRYIGELSFEGIDTVDINLDNIDNMDSSGAIFIDSISTQLKNQKINIICHQSEIIKNLALIHAKMKNINTCESVADKHSLLYNVGFQSVKAYKTFLSFLSFFGELNYSFYLLLLHPSKIRYKEIIFEINANIIKAFGIIAVTSFLVGVVVAYQSSIQLAKYGANIFIVDMLGLSILRELGPLITAIIIAGRSGSFFTAQIGAMKVTLEIDAMQTMGFDSMRFLVIPRIVALVLMMPVLIFIADISGLFGGMLVAKYQLGISASFFIGRFLEIISVKQFLVGIIKGPFFAFLIASIAIYHGLNVKNDTQSIGVNTTKSVVESIFAIIVCDAVFSIIFTVLGI